jgi:hypothetical protein
MIARVDTCGELEHGFDIVTESNGKVRGRSGRVWSFGSERRPDRSGCRSA